MDLQLDRDRVHVNDLLRISHRYKRDDQLVSDGISVHLDRPLRMDTRAYQCLSCR
jgi:hypothetical protein